jgi:hypothetical protein
MWLGLLVIGLQSVAVFGFNRLLVGLLYYCPDTYFPGGLEELKQIEGATRRYPGETGQYPGDLAWPHIFPGLLYILVPFVARV